MKRARRVIHYKKQAPFYIRNNAFLKKTVTLGKTVGFQLRIRPLINDNNYPLSLTTGLKIFISNQSFTPSSNDNFISIEPGKETDIIVDRTFTSNTPNPYSDCTDLSKGYDSELYKFLINSNRTYRQSDCNSFCLQRLWLFLQDYDFLKRPNAFY